MTLHAIARAKERLGIEVNHDDLAAAFALIGTDPRAVFVRKYDDGSELWIAPLKGVTAGLYVRREKRCVVSVIESWKAARGGKRGEYSRAARHAMKRAGRFGRRISRLLKRDAVEAE